MEKIEIDDWVYDIYNQEKEKAEKTKYIDKVMADYKKHFGSGCYTINQPLPDALFAIVLKTCIKLNITYEDMFGIRDDDEI